jgi:hypothetical protein
MAFDEGSPYGRPRARRQRSGCLTVLSLLLLLIGLVGAASWIGWLPIPVRSWVHIGPENISLAHSSTLYIRNKANQVSSSFRLHDPALVRIQGGNLDDTIQVSVANVWVIGDSHMIATRSADQSITYLTIDYYYKGTIDITVPTNINIIYESHESGIEVKGITGRLLINSYQGNIALSNSTLTGPSLLKGYNGNIAAQNVTLKAPCSFETYNGAVTFQGSLAPQGHHFFNSYKGAITLTLPSNAAFTVEAENYQNSINSDFPGLPSVRPGTSTTRLSGSVGKAPYSYLHLSTYQNSITLQKGA